MDTKDVLAILTESLLKISQFIGTPRNTFLGNYNSISNLYQKYIPMVSCQMFSYAPHAKRSPMAAFLYVEHVEPHFILLRKSAPFHFAWRPSGTAFSLQAFARSNTFVPAFI